MRNMGRIAIWLCAALIILLLAGGTSMASISSWKQTNGPYGGRVSSIAINPTNTQIIHVVAGGELYRSTNDGTNWVPTGLKNINVVTVDPQSPQIAYAGGNGIFKSTDGGENWNAVNNGLPSSIYISNLAVAQSDPQIIYAGTWYGGIYKSTNGGANWNSINNSLNVGALTIDPTNSQVVYIGIFSFTGMGGGIYKSTDGGSSWNRVGLANASVYSVAIDPTNPQVVYAGYSTGNSWDLSGVDKSADGGISWSTTYIGRSVFALAIDPTNPLVIYAGTGGDLLKTTDGGISWNLKEINFASVMIFSLAINPQNNHVVYAGGEGGVYKSTDGVESWSPVNNGIIKTFIASLAVDPTNPQVVYAGESDGGGAHKSTDGGGPWNLINNGLNDNDVVALAIDHTNPQVIYAGSYDTFGSGGVHKSTNGGASWIAKNNGLTNIGLRSLVIAKSSTQVIYVSGDGVFKSTDGGEHWNTINNGIPLQNNVVQSLAVDPTDSQLVYAGTWGKGIYKSTDGGAIWSAIGSNSTYISSIAIDPINPHVVYASAYYGSSFNNVYGGGVYKSTNEGMDWSFIGLNNTDIWSLIIDPANTQTIYVGTVDGVFKSINGGTSWILIDTGLTDKYVRSIAIAPSDTRIIYAGTFSDGVYTITTGMDTTPSASIIGYSALVATGQNTYVQSSNGTFGLLLKGQSKTINNSVILNNTGDISAKVEVRFNDSIAGVFGLISGANVLNATNFALGLPSSLVPLNNSGADAQVAVAPPGVTVLDARLGVPNEQAAGDYSGTVVLTFSNNV